MSPERWDLLSSFLEFFLEFLVDLHPVLCQDLGREASQTGVVGYRHPVYLKSGRTHYKPIYVFFYFISGFVVCFWLSREVVSAEAVG